MLSQQSETVKLRHINRNTIFQIVFPSVVVFVSSFYMAREGMLHAYDEGMTDGDYAFIMFVLDQSEMSIYTKQSFKWFFSSYTTSLNRYHHVEKAFEAAFVLAIKSPSSESYPNFTAELKKRSKDPPFFSKVYEGYLWTKTTKFPANKTEVSYFMENQSSIFIPLSSPLHLSLLVPIPFRPSMVDLVRVGNI